ncbi:MAG: thiosulfate oxidation carrier complex protein SoxZ [Pseudomonadota bacterium]
MTPLIKIRARLDGDKLDLRTLSNHPMETGQRKDGAGQTVAAHFIEHFTVTLNGRTVVQVECAQGLSANPPLGFRLKGAKVGDLLVVAWQDSRGEKNSETLVLA